MSAIDLLRQAAAAFEAEQRKPAKYLTAVSFRDSDRGQVHEVFRAVIENLETHGWSRNRISELLRVNPTTLMDWIESGDKPRNQLPGWIFAAFTRLPDHAWDVFMRELTALRCSVRKDDDVR